MLNTVQIVSGYIYHNHMVLRQPYSIRFNIRSSKEIKKINEHEALQLTNFWYDELKEQQRDTISSKKNLQNINILYSHSNEEYLKMSNLMNFNYNIQSKHSCDTEYLIWKPKISPTFITDLRTNSILYPCFRQTLCLVSFKRIYNDVDVENMWLKRRTPARTQPPTCRCSPWPCSRATPPRCWRGGTRCAPASTPTPIRA